MPILTQNGSWRKLGQATRSPVLLLVEQAGPVDALALEEHGRDALGRRDVLQRITVDEKQAGVITLADQADALIGAQQASGVVGRTLQGRPRAESPLPPTTAARDGR